MTQKQASNSVTFTNAHRLKPEGIVNNVSVFEATFNGEEYIVTMSKKNFPVTGENAARFGQPWSRLAQCFQWRSKKPGSASVRTDAGELSGLMLQVNISKYHPELDNRPKRSEIVQPVMADDLPF